MNAPRGGFRHAVNCMTSFASHPDLDNAGIILHQLAYRLTAQAPEAGKFADAVMFLESPAIKHVFPYGPARVSQHP